MRWPSVPRTALGASRAAQTREDRRPLALLRRGGSRGRAWVQQTLLAQLPVSLSAAHVQGHGQLRHVRGAPPTAGRWPLSKEGLGERSSPARGDRPQPGGKAVTRTRERETSPTLSARPCDRRQLTNGV